MVNSTLTQGGRWGSRPLVASNRWAGRHPCPPPLQTSPADEAGCGVSCPDPRRTRMEGSRCGSSSAREGLVNLPPRDLHGHDFLDHGRGRRCDRAPLGLGGSSPAATGGHFHPRRGRARATNSSPSSYHRHARLCGRVELGKERRRLKILRGAPAFKKARVRLQRPLPRILRFRESRRLSHPLDRPDNSKASPPGRWGKTLKT